LQFGKQFVQLRGAFGRGHLGLLCQQCTIDRGKCGKGKDQAAKQDWKARHGH